MTLQIEEGKYYRTRDGHKVGPAKRVDAGNVCWNIPLELFGKECFSGYFADGTLCIDMPEKNIVAEWKDTEEMTHEDTPKMWKDMTDEEKGALLLAHHEGKTIEQYQGMFGWQEVTSFEEPLWRNKESYRVKPAPKEPKRETTVLYGSYQYYNLDKCPRDTHKIAFDLIDGVPDCGSIKMEEL